MEEQSFPWLVHFLALNSADVPVLDCYAVREGEVLIYYYRNISLQFCFELVECELSELLVRIWREYEILCKLSLATETTCFFFIGNTKKSICENHLEYIVEKSEYSKKISLIQLVKQGLKSSYDFELERTKNKYTCRFLHLVDHKLVACKDRELFQKVLNIAKSLNSTIKQFHFKEIYLLRMEVMKDLDSNLWISDLYELKLINIPAESKNQTSELTTNSPSPVLYKKPNLKKRLSPKKTNKTVFSISRKTQRSLANPQAGVSLLPSSTSKAQLPLKYMKFRKVASMALKLKNNHK